MNDMALEALEQIGFRLADLSNYLTSCQTSGFSLVSLGTNAEIRDIELSRRKAY